MELDELLRMLEDTGLIRQTQAQPDRAYLFKHALVQDAVYASLLKQDRRELHRATGKVLEQLAGNRLDENAALLAFHFDEAGDKIRALKYYRLAGEHAMHQYAVPEALMQFSKAIDLAGGSDAALPALYRMRGLAYESQGEFEPARADHEMALQVAHGQGDTQAEWRSQLDLGMLWAGRDYTRTGMYYQQAYEQARVMGNDIDVAHALNHLGNWYVNLDRPGEGTRFHLQALAIFEQVQDESSMAATLDFLGMASVLSTDITAGKLYYQRAIPFLRQTGDLIGLSSTLASCTLLCPAFMTETCSPVASVQEVIELGYEALQIARQIHRRDAEAYALTCLAKCHGSQGNYARAWDAATQSLTVAQAIGHRQWQVYAHLFIGKLLTDFSLIERAQLHMEQAQMLAEELGSVHWRNTANGLRVHLYVVSRELALAQSIIDQIHPEIFQAQTISQHAVLAAWAELLLAQGIPQKALGILDLLDLPRGISSPPHISWLVACLRGQALTMLGQTEAAEASLQAAYRETLEQEIRPAQQHVLTALSQLRERQGRTNEAGQLRADADKLAQELAFQPPE